MRPRTLRATAMCVAVGLVLALGVLEVATAKECREEAPHCRTWNVWDGRHRRCYTVRRAGDRLELFMQRRWTTVLLERVPDETDAQR